MLLCMLLGGMVWRHPPLPPLPPPVEIVSSSEDSPASDLEEELQPEDQPTQALAPATGLLRGLREPTCGKSFEANGGEFATEFVSDSEDMVATRSQALRYADGKCDDSTVVKPTARRRHDTSNDNVHAEREEPKESDHFGKDGPSNQAADSDYLVLHRDWDWEERRLRGRLASNRLKRAYVCLRPSCRDDLGIPKSFTRLHALNHHRVTKHAGATVIFSNKGVARARVAQFTNAQVRSTKDKNCFNIYMKQHRLEKSAGIQFQAFFQSTCRQHEEAWAELKSSFIENYIERGMLDYKAKKEGKKVVRHESIIESKSCIMCAGSSSQWVPMEFTDVDSGGGCSLKDSQAHSIIDISSDSDNSVKEEPIHNLGEEKHGSMADFHRSEEHAQDDEMASPLVSAGMMGVDQQVIDNLCERFTHSLPCTNKGFRFRLVDYLESSDSESDHLHGVDCESVTLHKAVCESLPTTTNKLDEDVCPLPAQQSTRVYNTRFRGQSMLSYAETKRRTSKKQGLNIPL